MKIKITTDVPLEQTPVHIICLQKKELPHGPWQLRPLDGGVSIPAQGDIYGNGVQTLLTMPVGTAEFELESAPAPESNVILREGDEQLEILLPDGPFGTYHYEKTAPRPYIWPLYGPGGVELTRAFPMENREGEKQDHPHHRSLWTAFDEVNGVNNWHEGEGHGWTRHQEIIEQYSGPVYGGFRALSHWTNAEDKPFLREVREICLYNLDGDVRVMDYDVYWNALHGAVSFGDTKEAGVITIRVATSMDGERGGVITNSNGGRGEKECWGKQAHWCDYTGKVNGEKYGITIFHNPTKPNARREPPRWHVRDYGLFATNPFSVAAFEGGEKQQYVLHNGGWIVFHYRVLLHKGEATEQIHQIWNALANPPKINIEK